MQMKQRGKHLQKEGVEIIEKLVERMDMNHIVAQMRELEHYNSEVAKNAHGFPLTLKQSGRFYCGFCA